jgi:putative ABC transport system ATP-binding protein
MTALENVELPLTFSGYTSIKGKEIAKKLLETVQLGDRMNHFPNMLRLYFVLVVEACLL